MEKGVHLEGLKGDLSILNKILPILSESSMTVGTLKLHFDKIATALSSSQRLCGVDSVQAIYKRERNIY